MQNRNEKRRHLAHIVIPVIFVVLVMAALVGGFVLWSTKEADDLAARRQQRLVATALAQRTAAIAHDQEASTVWDDAVRHLAVAPPDPAWLDANLGVWFHTYYAHDQVYVIDGQGRAVYAMRGGRRAAPALYDRMMAPVARPMIAQLRRIMLDRSTSGRPSADRSPGVSDLGVVDHRPSIISIKPIIPEGDGLLLKPGTEHLHISVRHLDASFVAALSQQYLLDGAHFSWSGRHGAGESATPLRSAAGRVIGYVVWKPFRPGGSVLAQIGPALAAALLLVSLVVGLLLRRIRRSGAELQASEAQAQYLAFHDALTGLANRALFENRLAHDLAIARRAGPGLALLYLDLDRFKSVNDTLGHPAGDELIRALGRRLTEATREADTVARLGGDEFVIIQTGVTTAADVEILCMRLVEAANEPFDIAGHQVNVGISIGVAMAPAHGLDRVELSRKADIALYQAKGAGRGRYMMFAESMDAGIRERELIERDLRAALCAGGQFELHYQPVLAARTGRISGVEALIRWRHPEQGLLLPNIFIPIAEECGLIEPIGEWALGVACATARAWPIETLAVNVSAAQLRNPDFAERTIAIIAASGLAPDRLELEITETCFIENAAQCAPNISALRRHGVGVALDDFGTGYSSLSHLRQFEVDRVKIDRSFVNGIDPKAGGSAIIEAIVGLARATGLKVTAEGVETAEQRRFLVGIGCTSLQGFHLSRPLPRERMEALFGSDTPALLSHGDTIPGR